MGTVKAFNPHIMTREGFQVGDPVSKLKELYGEPADLYKCDNSFGTCLYYIGGFRVSFMLDVIHGEFGKIVHSIEIQPMN